MAKIRILPIHLVNKIAAGECIERPASIVKELVENALDAGATKIDVLLEQGGCKRIRVVDNGSGIGPDELPLAVTPHATSKLGDENDLYAIRTMGFRGEALTSIGAVAILKISSHPPESEAGAEIEVQGGTTGPVRPAAHPGGTAVDVQNLFFNTPARRKFLKSAQTELGHCQEAVVRLALAYPNIGFSLAHGERRLLQLSPAETPRTRIADIFGPETADGLIQVFAQTRDITFSAYVSRPDHAKPAANAQYFFVNRRAVRDRYIAHALKEAYRGLMPPDRQPVGFLFLELDPSIVDVNVHPAKSEVRFADSGVIHSMVLGAIRERFLSTDLTAGLTVAPPAESAETEPEIKPHQQKVKEALADFLKSHPAEQTRIPFSPPKYTPPTPPPVPAEALEEKSTMPEPVESEPITASPSPASMTEPETRSRNRVIQIHNSYLVVETPDGLMIVDQHALHERILYQQLRATVNAGPVPRQKLLVPELVQVTGEQMEQIDAIRSSLEASGVEVEPFGPQTLAVHSLPAVVGHLDAVEFVRELLARLDKVSKVEPEQVLEHVLQSLACKGAVKAGDPLKPEEIQALLESRHQVDLASACPHGRPTALQMSLTDLQKQFKRT